MSFNETHPLSVDIPKDKIAVFCRHNYIHKLSLYGSILRNDFRPDSDIDILVEFKPGHVPGFFQLARLEQGLSELLGNRKVDMRTLQELSRYFRDEVAAAAEVQYAEK